MRDDPNDGCEGDLGCRSLLVYIVFGRHVARLRRRRRRAYEPTSNTASHDNHEKIHSWMPFSFPYEYGAPLGGPSDRRSSAKIVIANLAGIYFLCTTLTKEGHAFRNIGKYIPILCNQPC